MDPQILPRKGILTAPAFELDVVPGCPPGGLTADRQRSPLVSLHIHRHHHSTAPRPSTQARNATFHWRMKAQRATSESGLALFQTASWGGGRGSWLISVSGYLFHYDQNIKAQTLASRGEKCLLSTDPCINNNNKCASNCPGKQKFTPCCSLGFKHQGFSNKQLKVEAQPWPSLPAWFGPSRLLCSRSFSLPIN